MMLKRNCGRILWLLLAMAAAASMLGQEENQPYFALSSFRTFGSGGKPSVALNAWNVDSLEFRVYRINDAQRFFEQLEEPHQFGGRAPKPPRERTTLERIRYWKRSLRADIRRSLRAQFNESPSAHFRTLAGEKTPANQPVNAINASRYAEAPLLNPQQMVLSFTHPVRGVSRWENESVEVPVTDKGVYLVEAVNHELRAYTILFVSDLVMISKAGKGRVLNFVVDRRTGLPVAGITVTALGKQGEPASAKTDSDGIAEVPIAGSRNAQFTLFARNNSDVAVNTMGIGLSGEAWTGYIYTDRPVYRPGHMVHFKALLRLRSSDGYDVPAGRKVSVEIDDPDQKPVYQKTLTTTANGTIADDLALAPGAALGSYYIQVKAAPAVVAGGAVNEGESYENQASGSFDVEAYRKPEYEVRVTPAKNRVLQGETVQAVIDARYFFGEPVANAKVKYSIYRNRYWFPLWYDAEDLQDLDQSGDDGDQGDQLTDKAGQLDADGKLTIDVPTAVSDKGVDYMYRVEARVTDAANREISGVGRVLGTYGSFLLNVQPDRYVYEPGGQASVTIQARDYDSQPVRAHVHVEMHHGFGREAGAVISAADVDVDASGQGKTGFAVPSGGGIFEVRATAKTPEGREVSDTTYLWVSGGIWAEAGARRKAVEIVPDKKTYKPGDTAKVLIAAGEPGAALYVTLEGRDIRQHRLIRSQGSTATFEFPVDARYEPGITVSVISVRDGAAATGAKYIRVPPTDHQLNVALKTDKPQYKPGDTAEYSIDVTDARGKAVPRADLSLGVVDEAIYGVRPDVTPNILSFFFGRDYNSVFTQNSLEYYFTGQAGKKHMQLADLRPRSRLAQLKPERLVQPKVRKAFPDTAYWAADVVTDASGHARAKVEFPDSLTTWRATARGITTTTTSVGSAVLKTIVRKNLILRLATPRFLVVGDEVTISALVHNYLPDAKTARVSLDVTGLDVLSGRAQDVMIPSRGEAKVDWRVRAQRTRSVTLTGKALTDEESDALEMDVPVNFPGIKLNISKGGSVNAGGSAEFDVAFPDKIEPGSRSLSIRLAPSIAGSLFGALDYLTSFPYGCVEQTMSSFLPDIIVKDVVHTLGLKTQIDEASLQEKIRAGLERLYSFQHDDGGWGWWQTDESHPFMTAYVVAGLVQARATGTQVNDDAINKGVAWLKKDLGADSKLAADFRAYLIYALTVAGQNDAAELSAMYARRADLSPYGMALLGLALENAKDARAGEIAGALESSARQDDEQAWWPATRDPLLDFEIDATPEATAYVTRFLSHERKNSPLLPKAALWLVNHRNEGYWWSSTKQTAMVIYGLTDYLRVTNELMPNANVTVFVNEKPVLTRKLDQSTMLDSPDFVLDESKLQQGMNHVRVATSGMGRVYYGARAEYYSSEARFQKTGTTSLNLLRDYFRLVPGRNGDRIVYDTVPLDSAVAPGDTIAVRLTVTGSEWKYMMIEDPIPAGTEFIEKDNLYELRNPPSWWTWYFDRRELHDDRMAIFQTYYGAGQREYFYLLKVVNPGVFVANPARVGPMYQSDVMATTESRRIEVR